jgi:hypothetical protein
VFWWVDQTKPGYQDTKPTKQDEERNRLTTNLPTEHSCLSTKLPSWVDTIFTFLQTLQLRINDAPMQPSHLGHVALEPLAADCCIFHSTPSMLLRG